MFVGSVPLLLLLWAATSAERLVVLSSSMNVGVGIDFCSGWSLDIHLLWAKKITCVQPLEADKKIQSKVAHQVRIAVVVQGFDEVWSDMGPELHGTLHALHPTQQRLMREYAGSPTSDRKYHEETGACLCSAGDGLGLGLCFELRDYTSDTWTHSSYIKLSPVTIIQRHEKFASGTYYLILSGPSFAKWGKEQKESSCH